MSGAVCIRCFWSSVRFKLFVVGFEWTLLRLRKRNGEEGGWEMEIVSRESLWIWF